MSTVNLIDTRHPHKTYERRFALLVGIDAQKQTLLENLVLFFDQESLKKWLKKHHKRGLPFFEQYFRASPLMLLSGEVGCGKTELAQSIGSPLAHRLGGQSVMVFETPSDVRGSGLVGELSNRITAAFTQAKSRLRSGQMGILIIDEVDDLATSRSQNQAHHEDRAGVNALIKEIDRLEREEVSLAVIMITNRASSIDPAILRRAATQLTFSRPNADTLHILFDRMLEGTMPSSKEIDQLVAACTEKEVPFSYSDILRRVGKQALVASMQTNQAFSAAAILKILRTTQPSPLIL